MRKNKPAGIDLRPSRVKRIVRGAAGVTKAAIGLDKAGGNLMMQRWAVCGSCNYAVKIAGIVQTCGLCHCMLRAKIRLAREHCPAGKW